MAPDELLQPMTGTLRHEVAPAVADAFARRQADHDRWPVRAVAAPWRVRREAIR